MSLTVDMKTEPDLSFQTYDITLTDRELEDFLSFMDHQTTGCYADGPPQLPDIAVGFPGLQLQPHTDSPSMSNSEGSESIGVDPPMTSLPAFAGSACSLSTAGDMNLAAGDMTAGVSLSSLQGESAQGMVPGSDLDNVPRMSDCVDIKMEDQPFELSSEAPMQHADSTAVPAPASADDAAMPAAAGAMPAAAVAVSTPFMAPGSSGSLPLASLQPAAMLRAPAAAAAPGMAGMTPWGAVAAGAVVAGQQAALQQVLFIQPGRAKKQQQQLDVLQLQRHHSAQPAAVAAVPTASKAADAPQPRSTGSGGRGMQRTQSCEGISSGGGKFQISHSTVEKQRRDRLNSLIDELSDIVPPADPKYGNEASSVRRPKHVVLADTINLLKAMQAKLQIEEAEICTLKQQAAAVVAMAAAQQHPPSANAANTSAGAGCSGNSQAADDTPVLPVAPEGCACSGVLVEQGVDCLFVKVNCQDRKGLLADVVSALKTLPLVINTAAITTTKNGTVHDVFEVSIEDNSVTPEDIQCAVHLALFSPDRLRSKRLRQEDRG